MAAFTVDEGLDAAREIELSVAPDIAVELRRKGRKLARPGDTLAVGTGTRAPRFKRERERLARLDASDEPSAPPETAAATAPEPPAEPPPPAAAPSVHLRRARAPRRPPGLGQPRARAGTRASRRPRQDRRGRAHDQPPAAHRAGPGAGRARGRRDRCGPKPPPWRPSWTTPAGSCARPSAATRPTREALTRRHEEATRCSPAPERPPGLSGDHEQVTQAHAALQAELQRERRGAGIHARGAGHRARRGGAAAQPARPAPGGRQRDATAAAARGAADDIPGIPRLRAGPRRPEVAEPRASRRSRSRTATQHASPTRPRPSASTCWAFTRSPRPRRRDRRGRSRRATRRVAPHIRLPTLPHGTRRWPSACAPSIRRCATGRGGSAGSWPSSCSAA